MVYMFGNESFSVIDKELLAGDLKNNNNSINPSKMNTNISIHLRRVYVIIIINKGAVFYS